MSALSEYPRLAAKSGANQGDPLDLHDGEESGVAGQPFGGAVFTVVDRIEHEFDARADAELIEDSEHVLLHGVFTQREFLGDFTVSKTFGNQRYHLLLAGSEQVVTVGVDHTEGGHLGDEIDEIRDLLRRRPDLTLMNDLNALAECAEWRVGEAEEAAGTERKALTASSRSQDSISRILAVFGCARCKRRRSARSGGSAFW